MAHPDRSGCVAARRYLACPRYTGTYCDPFPRAHAPAVGALKPRLAVARSGPRGSPCDLVLASSMTDLSEPSYMTEYWKMKHLQHLFPRVPFAHAAIHLQIQSSPITSTLPSASLGLPSPPMSCMSHSLSSMVASFISCPSCMHLVGSSWPALRCPAHAGRVAMRLASPRVVWPVSRPS